MWSFSSQVEIIPWQEEFAVADKNPEVIEEIEYWDFLAESGAIPQEEANRRIEEVLRKNTYSSRTEGIAFMEEGTVSFRSKVPKLHIILHELGHVFFKEPDPVWSDAYAGGETLMWLSIKGYAQTKGEESIQRWHEYMKMVRENPEKLKAILDEKAQRVIDRLNLRCNEDTLYIDERIEKSPVMSLCLMSGTLPLWVKESGYHMILINALEGARYGEFLYKELLEELLEAREPELELEL
jgi:hypothetical protein